MARLWKPGRRIRWATAPNWPTAWRLVRETRNGRRDGLNGGSVGCLTSRCGTSCSTSRWAKAPSSCSVRMRVRLRTVWLVVPRCGFCPIRHRRPGEVPRPPRSRVWRRLSRTGGRWRLTRLPGMPCTRPWHPRTLRRGCWTSTARCAPRWRRPARTISTLPSGLSLGRRSRRKRAGQSGPGCTGRRCCWFRLPWNAGVCGRGSRCAGTTNRPRSTRPSLRCCDRTSVCPSRNWTATSRWTQTGLTSAGSGRWSGPISMISRGSRSPRRWRFQPSHSRSSLCGSNWATRRRTCLRTRWCDGSWRCVGLAWLTIHRCRKRLAWTSAWGLPT